MALACPACQSILDAPDDDDRAEIPCPNCSALVPVPTTLVPVAAIIEAPSRRPSQRALIVEEGRELEKEEKWIAVMAHLLGPVIAIFVDPLFGFLGPLIILMVKGKESSFVKHHAKEALNYQITVGILSILFGLTFLALFAFGLVYEGIPKELNSRVILFLCCLGLTGLMEFLLEIYSIFITIRASIKGYRGEWYRYPHCFRFVK
jgi:hypothetical protein